MAPTMVRVGVGHVALAVALTTAADVAASSWSQTRFGTADDLPSPYVKGAVEDEAGFVWLATDGGLVRFDGSSFTSFLDAASGRFVKAVALLPDGRVLVAGDSGVSVVSSGSGELRISRLVPGAEFPSATALHYPKSLFVDSRGRAWVSEMEAVCLLLGGPRFERFAFPPEARSTSFVRSFSLAEDGWRRIWAASRSGGLFAFDETQRRFLAVPLPAGTPATDNANHLAAVANDVLWLAAEGGLLEIRLAAERPAVVSARAVPGFAAPSWITRLGSDLLVTSHTAAARRVRLGEAGPGTALSAASAVQHALVTRAGDVYLSSDDGLVRLRQRPFEPLPLPEGELAFNVQSFALGPAGRLYACDRRAVYRLDPAGASFRPVRVLDLPGTMLLGLLGDGNRLAVAGLGRLLLFADGRVTRTLDLSERGTHVVGLAGTGDGSLWISQFDSRGASRLLPDGRLRAYSAEAGLPGRVIALLVGGDGKLYATGAGPAEYLFRYDPARDAFTNLSRPPRFNPPEPFDVRDLEVDRTGHIWLASTAGLLEQDQDCVRRVDLGPELTGLPTHSLARTGDGRLWVATSAGLVGFDPERRTYELHDETSGLPSKNLGFHGLFAVGEDLLVATTHGIARARVSDLRAGPSSPPVIIQVRADGRELDLDGERPQVPHGAWLGVRVASPGGGERTYQWRLQPEDADWRPASTRPEAVLPTRTSGEHRLQVRAAARGSNLWGPAAQLRLWVAPAWYQRWWGMASVGAVLAFVFAVGLALAQALAARHERQLSRLVAARTSELREASQRFTAVFESAPMGITIASPQGRFLEVNDHLLAVLGYTRDEMKAMTLFELTHPEDRERTFTLVEAVRSGAAPGYDVEKRYLAKDGAARWVRVHSTALRTPQGAVEFWIGLVEDITARRRLDAEKAELQSQLQQAQKMESVGRLAGGVAHDFNNMLHVIMGFVDLLRRRMPGDGRLAMYVDEIGRAARRAQEVTHQLLAFSRRQVIAPAPSDLNQLVARLGGALARLIGEDVQLHVHAAEKLWTVNVDPTQIDQILLNLAVNARDAMPAGGRLTIETANIRLDETYCRTQAAARPGDYVLLAVSDDGVGMDKDTLSRLFEPFFTTKEKGKGTGLGLAMVHGIVQQNGGFVNVYSEPGRGTTFRVYLPRTLEERSVPAQPPSPPGEVAGGTVLVVEDDESVRRLTTALVESLGCRVVPASSGAEAVELCRRGDPRIDVVLTDVVMPGMSGIELRDCLQEIRPGIKILFTSGYTANVIAHHGILDEGLHFLAKPFGVTGLARALRELLAPE